MKLLDYKKEIYHVHTTRCGHASGLDQEIIEACIASGMMVVTVTDHAPFPGNPFGNRMKYEELEEYLKTYTDLRQKYQDDIAIHIGLETEYFPQFEDYYHSLNKIPELDAGLLLGQHMYIENGIYSFDMDREYLKKEEYKGMGHAIVEGISSGYFRRIAHPDRIYRRMKKWDDGCEEIAKQIIKAAVSQGMPLEVNLRTIARKKYRPELWKLVSHEEESIVYIAPDAHSIEDIMNYRQKVEQFLLSDKNEIFNRGEQYYEL